MRAVRKIVSLVAMAVMLLPLVAHAQESSIGTFSPYTMYGLGNMNFTGSVPFGAMGGASLGFRNGGFDSQAEYRVNTSNPASLGSLTMGRSLILDVGMTGGGFYLRQMGADKRAMNSSFNTFNLGNATVAFPVARTLGFAVNISPFSQVGYRVRKEDTSRLGDIGLIRYIYQGEGDMTELKVGMGWDIVPDRFAIGAEMIYLWGSIDRSYRSEVASATGNYNGVSASTVEKISRVTAGFGMQITPLSTRKSRLTLGLTYRLGQKLNARTTDYISSSYSGSEPVRNETTLSSIYLPHTAGAGIYFHRPRWAIGFDYLFHNWKSSGYDKVNDVRYINTNTYRLGLQYTPNRRDIGVKAGNFFNRITYRVGARYNDYYMTFGGRKLNEKAVSIGFDIPFSSMRVSNVSLGFEVGERGRLSGNLIRERYWKISLGVMLFGRDYDYWFEKYKYN